MKENKKEKNRTKVLMLMTALTAILLIASTYAWFSVNRNVSIEGINAKVSAAEGLKISLDAEEWVSDLTVSQEILAALAGKNTYNWIDTTQGLIPVSVTGELDNTKNDVAFVKGNLSSDGNSLNNVSLSTPDTTKKTGDYIAFDLYIKNTSSQTTDKLQIGTGSGIVPGVKDTGVEASARMGILLYEGSIGTLTDTPETIRSLSSSTSKFTIWEPYADIHSSLNTSLSGVLDTYAISNTVLNGAIGDVTVSSINGPYTMGSFVKQITTQTTGHTQNANNTDLMETASVKTLIDTNSAEVELKGNSIYKTRVYIWLEGQDADCIDTATAGKTIDFYINLEKPIVTATP